VVSSTRLRPHRPRRPKTTAPSRGTAHRCFETTPSTLVASRVRVVVREPVPSVVTHQDWFPPRRLSTETIRQGCLRVRPAEARSKQAALKPEGKVPNQPPPWQGSRLPDQAPFGFRFSAFLRASGFEFRIWAGSDHHWPTPGTSCRPLLSLFTPNRISTSIRAVRLK